MLLVTDEVASGCSMEDAGAGAACGGGGVGRAQLISAATDIVGLSFFATLDMATHEHPHITDTPLHYTPTIYR